MHVTAELEQARGAHISKCNVLIRVRALKNHNAAQSARRMSIISVVSVANLGKYRTECGNRTSAARTVAIWRQNAPGAP
jgi:hypothetical protein